MRPRLRALIARLRRGFRRVRRAVGSRFREKPRFPTEVAASDLAERVRPPDGMLDGRIPPPRRAASSNHDSPTLDPPA